MPTARLEAASEAEIVAQLRDNGWTEGDPSSYRRPLGLDTVLHPDDVERHEANGELFDAYFASDERREMVDEFLVRNLYSTTRRDRAS